MAWRKREHSSDEFGRVGSAAIRGAEAPTLGASTLILIDGMVERESGVTPPPPAITVTAIAITLVVMLLLGFAIMVYATAQPAPDLGDEIDMSMSRPSGTFALR